MSVDQGVWTNLVDIGRRHIAPIFAILSFFPVYFFAYLYVFPSNIRVLLGSGMYSSAVFELIVVLAACGLIGRLNAYQLFPLFEQATLSTEENLRFQFLAPVHRLFLRLAFIGKNEVWLTALIFFVALFFYFLGVFGLILGAGYAAILVSSFGHWERNRQIKAGQQEAVYLDRFKIAQNAFKDMTASQMLEGHMNFIGIVILTLAMVLGGTRGISLLSNQESYLHVGRSVEQVRLLAATDHGLIFISSEDASILGFILRRPAEFFLVSSGGSITCFGIENQKCRGLPSGL